MPGIDRGTGHVGGPFLPDRERSARIRYARRAPERAYRHGDLLSGLAVGFVVLEVGRAPGAIILAGRMDTRRIGKERVVMRERARIEGGHIFGFGPACLLVIDIAARVFL